MRKREMRIGLGAVLSLVCLLAMASWGRAEGPPVREDVKLINQIGGSAKAVVVRDNIAYLGLGPSLHLVDVSNPASPRFLGWVMLPGLVEDVFVSGSLVYVANGKFGLRVVDVSDPTFPREIGHLETLAGNARGVFVSGVYAYVAAETEGLWVIDVSNPASPKNPVQWKEAAGSAYGVHVSGPLAYVAYGGAGLQILNISNPGAPSFKGSYTNLPDVAYGVYVVGAYAYLADGLGGLRAIDISDPAVPKKAATYDTPGTAYRVYVSLPYAYVADGIGGLRVINVENPSFFREVGYRRSPDCGYHALGVYSAGAVVYVANGGFGLEVIDVANPTVPQPVGAYQDELGLATDIFISGIHAYLPDGGPVKECIQIIDISNPLLPAAMASYDPLPLDTLSLSSLLDITSLFVTDDWLGITDRGPLASGFRAVNIANSSAPAEKPGNPIPEPASDVFLLSSNLFRFPPVPSKPNDIFAFVVTPDGLTIVSMESMTTLGSFALSGARKVFVAANTTAVHAYLVGDFGLKVLDVTDPTNMLEVRAIPTRAPATSIFVRLPYAYVTVGAELLVIQVTDTAGRLLSPLQRLYDTVPLRGAATGIFFSGSSAYLSIGDFGLEVFDFSDPLMRPDAPTAAYQTPGQAMALFIDQGRIYLADGDGGLLILRHPIGPQIEVDLPSLDFEEVVVGEFQELFITVFNLGTRNLTIHDLLIDSADFSLVNAPTIPFTLHSGENWQVTVRFSPTRQGLQEASLTLISNDPDQPSMEVTLFATAISPDIHLDRSELDFGIAAVGSTSDLSLVVSNHGSADLIVTDLALSGDEFSLVDPPALPLTLRPGEVQGVIVRFSPTLEGSQQAALTLRSNDPDALEAVVALAGNAILVGQRPPLRQDIELVSQVGGSAKAVFVRGNIAYVGLGSSLHIVDVRNPANPVRLGQIPLPGLVEDIFVSASLHAYVANGKFGLRVVDVSKASSPREVGRLDTLGDFAYGVFVAGSHAYVANAGRGLRVIDVSDPAAPAEVSGLDTPGTAYDVAVSGNYAYVADGRGGLRVIDVSDPFHPVEVSSYPRETDLFKEGFATGVDVLGSYAYLADGKRGLRAIDVSDPQRPVKVGSFDTPRTAYRVFVSFPYAYVADRDGGLRVINVENSSFFWEVGHLNLSGFNWAGSAYGVFVAGSTAYVPNGDFGLDLIDVSNPSVPKTVGTYRSASGSVKEVFVSGIHAYLPAFDYGFQIVDISDPRSPTFKGFYDPPPPGSDPHDPPDLDVASLFVTDDWVGIADRAATAADGQRYGFRVVRVDNPSSPTEDANWTEHKIGHPGKPNDIPPIPPVPSILNPVPDPASDVFLLSRNVAPTSPPSTHIIAYVVTAEGLRVVDMGPLPKKPPKAIESGFGEYPVPSYPVTGAKQVFVVANSRATYAYLAGDFGLLILDVTDSANPQFRGSLSLGAPAVGLFVSFPHAYLITQTGLWVVDVSDPTSPRQHYDEPIPISGKATGIFVAGPLAHVSVEGFGIEIFDFSDGSVRPETPVAFYETPGKAMDLFIHQSRIYLADGEGGLFILRHKLYPKIEVDPAILDFGEVDVGGVKDLSLTVSNPGSRNLTIRNLSLDGIDFSLINPPSLPLVLAPGTSQTVVVRFSPSTRGLKQGTVTVHSNDPDRPSVEVGLTGMGILSDLNLSLLKGTEGYRLDFGELPLNGGRSRERSFTLFNDGTRRLKVTEVSLSGDGFALVSPTPPAAGSYLSISKGGGSVRFAVRFAPTASGPHGGQLTMVSDDPEEPLIIVQLVGSGAEVPDIRLDPPALSFESVVPGETKDLPFTVRNLGSGTLSVSGLSIDNARFRVVSPATPFEVPPGGPQEQGVEVIVRFAPTSTETESGTLSVVSNDPDESTAAVVLTGNDLIVRLLIDGGAPSTGKRRVTLTVLATPEIRRMRFSNDRKKWSPWIKAAPSKRWTLTNGREVTKTIWGQFKDKDGRIFEASDTIFRAKKKR